MTKLKKPLEASPVQAFEQSLTELEQLVAQMELGEQSLDDSLAAYERGIALYRQCQTALETAEQRVTLVSQSNPDQQTPFTDPSND